MTDKDRMIEIIKKAKRYYDPSKTTPNCMSFEAWFADYLLANGVIVPPCKVGDKVWLIQSLNWQRTEWGIKEGKISMIQQKVDKSWKFRVTENHSVQDYTVDSFGKTVFLTKEEAEAKLKECENNANDTK